MDTVVFKYPRISSLKGRCLARLLRGHSLTHRSFDSQTHTYRLAAAIRELRLDDWPIVTSWETADTADPTGRIAHYGVYDLQVDVISDAGAEGEEFARQVFEWEAQTAK